MKMTYNGDLDMDKIIHDANLARDIILAGGKDQILLDATRDLVPKLSATILMLAKALEIMSKSIADALQAEIPEDSEMKKAMADQWKFIIQQCIDEAMGRPVVQMEYDEDFNEQLDDNPGQGFVAFNAL